jgi:hypothetical protein
MELMRHSDIRLTMKNYTDATLLPTADASALLPGYKREGPQTPDATSHNGSSIETAGSSSEPPKAPDDNEVRRNLSRPVARSHS